MTTYLDLHVLQSVPPSNLNRDETGSPKTAVYGGVRRARVSSQSWKRAIRSVFDTLLDDAELGVRSKRLVDRIATEITSMEPQLKEQSQELAAEVLAATGIAIEKPKRGKKDDAPELSAESGYLIFMSNLQSQNLAAYAIKTHQAGEKPKKKDVVDIAKIGHSFDIALFGRMVADLTDLKVDAAAQVAHAISVHAVENEFDYFTAVDDHASGDHAGAGMIGTVEFNSSTLYRYATVNVDALYKHLGDGKATSRAVKAFTHAFVTSMPTGKQNTFANRTLPHAVVATLRTDQPINLVGAFEDPIELPSLNNAGPSRLARTCDAFVEHFQTVGSAFSAKANASWVVTAHKDAAPLVVLGASVDLDGLLAAVADATVSALQVPA